MMAYEVLVASDPDNIAYLVQDAIRKGLLPCGGVSVSSHQAIHGNERFEVVVYAQAVCKPAALVNPLRDAVKAASRRKARAK